MEYFSGASIIRPLSLPISLLLLLHLAHLPAPSTGLWCFCDPCLGPYLNGSCHAKPDSKCYASITMYRDKFTNDSFDVYEYGCLQPEDSWGFLRLPEDSSQLQCKGNLVPHTQPQGIECCDDADLCNQHLTPKYNEEELIPGEE